MDLDWVWDVIHLTSEDKTRRLDLDALRREVQSWFEPAALDEVFLEPVPRTDPELRARVKARYGDILDHPVPEH